MDRLDHIISGRHAALISEQRTKEHARVRGLVAANHKKRMKGDARYRVACNLRSRLCAALKAKKATKASVGLLGCSSEVLRTHLESLFTPGMTWGNYGLWHIDHVKPCASFDLLDPDEQRKCFHYTNLQPLWWIDNHHKGSKTL